MEYPEQPDRNGVVIPFSPKELIWGKLIPQEEWNIYDIAIQALRRAETGSLLGGAFGLAAYTGRWRNTKDIDFFIHPRDREKTIRALTEAGFSDYYSHLPYDRGWIYRATRSGVIVDAIWGMPNRRGEVDDQWFD